MKNFIIRGAVMFGALATVFGCSVINGDDGDSANSEDDLHRKPKATENWSNLTVQLPTGSCQPGQSCSHPLGATASITLDGAGITLGADNRIKPGDHTLTVNNTSTIVTMAAGDTKTFVLPVAHRKCTAQGLPTVAQTDFGKAISLSNATCPASATLDTSSGGGTKPDVTLYWYNWGCPSGNVTGTLNSSTNSATCGTLRSDRVYSINVNGRCIDLRTTRPDGQYGIAPADACNLYVGGDYSWTTGTVQNLGTLADYDIAFVPGKYSVTIPSNTGSTTQSFTLKQGDTSEIAIDLPVIGTVPSTFATNITFDDPRDLPDSAAATITSSCGGDRTYTVPASSTAALKLKAFTASSCVYTMNVNGRTVTLDQTSTNNIKLNRLDVDNVEVTRENGSTYTVQGRFEVYFGGTRIAGPYNTNTGIDLLPGTYELVITYSTADGPQTQRETFTL